MQLDVSYLISQKRVEQHRWSQHRPCHRSQNCQRKTRLSIILLPQWHDHGHQRHPHLPFLIASRNLHMLLMLRAERYCRYSVNIVPITSCQTPTFVGNVASPVSLQGLILMLALIPAAPPAAHQTHLQQMTLEMRYCACRLSVQQLTSMATAVHALGFGSQLAVDAVKLAHFATCAQKVRASQ